MYCQRGCQSWTNFCSHQAFIRVLVAPHPWSVFDIICIFNYSPVVGALTCISLFSREDECMVLISKCPLVGSRWPGHSSLAFCKFPLYFLILMILSGPLQVCWMSPLWDGGCWPEHRLPVLNHLQMVWYGIGCAVVTADSRTTLP